MRKLGNVWFNWLPTTDWLFCFRRNQFTKIMGNYSFIKILGLEIYIRRPNVGTTIAK